MPKHDFFSPKAISNRIKAKGLQKLRWYCEMCQKQCRDENGFKCHQTSDSHLRQMRIFAENPNAVMHNYSTEFEANFVETLSRRHGTKRVHANVVYQEYIADKHHVHMNATKWETLTNFVKYLGKSGQCVVDETEKGWYIAWVDRDPAALARQAAADKKRKHEMDDEERARRELKRQVKAAGGVLFGGRKANCDAFFGRKSATQVAGIKALPQYVRRSSRLIVLHSERYFSRLWCCPRGGAGCSTDARRGSSTRRLTVVRRRARSVWRTSSRPSARRRPTS